MKHLYLENRPIEYSQPHIDEPCSQSNPTGFVSPRDLGTMNVWCSFNLFGGHEHEEGNTICPIGEPKPKARGLFSIGYTLSSDLH